MKYISEKDVIKYLNEKIELSELYGYIFTHSTLRKWSNEIIDRCKCVEVPCQVGDSVWTYSPRYGIVEAKVSMITQKVDKSWKIRISHHSNVYEYTEDDIGERIFFDATSCNAKFPTLNLDNTINIVEVLKNE